MLMFWREVMEAYGYLPSSVFPAWIIVCTLVNAVFFFDLIFTVIHDRLKNSMRDFFVYLEVFLQILSISAFLKYLFTLNFFYTMKALELVILLRILRLLKLIGELHQFKIIIKTLGHLMVPFMTLFLVQVGVVYIYSIIGERIYGGLISYDKLRVLSLAGFGKEYVMLNFNDL